MVDIDSYIRPHLVDVLPYDPADPLESMAEKAGIPPDQIIRLNANENPYGASPRVADALAKLSPHIYPDPLQRTMRAELSRYTGVDDARIMVGAGSDELIDLLFRLLTSPGDAIIECEPTFGMYSFCSRLAEAETVSVPLDEEFEIDVDAVKGAIDSRSKIIFVNSPNNPTGNIVSTEQVTDLLETGLIVVVDEAYYEFCGETAADLLEDHENLVVLRTFSKWAGLAGLRVGYGMMSPRIVDHLIDIKPPFNVNTAGEAALLVSLEDANALLERVQRIVQERDRMYAALEAMDGVMPYPSGGNYVLCKFGPGKAAEIFDGLATRGIFVRMFRSRRLKDCFRISAGTPEQTDALLSAIRQLV